MSHKRGKKGRKPLPKAQYIPPPPRQCIHGMEIPTASLVAHACRACFPRYEPVRCLHGRVIDAASLDRVRSYQCDECFPRAKQMAAFKEHYTPKGRIKQVIVDDVLGSGSPSGRRVDDLSFQETKPVTKSTAKPKATHMLGTLTLLAAIAGMAPTSGRGDE